MKFVVQQIVHQYRTQDSIFRANYGCTCAHLLNTAEAKRAVNEYVGLCMCWPSTSRLYMHNHVCGHIYVQANIYNTRCLLSKRNARSSPISRRNRRRGVLYFMHNINKKNLIPHRCSNVTFNCPLFKYYLIRFFA